MASSDNFEGTLSLATPSGGVTAGTVIIDATTRVVMLPMTTTAVTTVNFVARVAGRIKSAPVISTMTGVQGASVQWSTSTSNFVYPTTGTTAQVQAVLCANFATGGTTADVILDMPRAYIAP